MSRVSAVCWLGAVLIAPALIGAGDSRNPPAPSRAAIREDELLRVFSLGDWRQRRAATAELERLGPDAESLLRRLLRRDLDDEAIKNVEAALQQVCENKLLGPSLITLHVKNASAEDVLENISKQCLGPIPVAPDLLLDQVNAPKLTLHYDRRPFWEVMGELSERLGVQYLASDPQELRITRGVGRSQPSISISGAFLVTASATTFRSRMTLSFCVYGEPKIALLQAVSLELDRALDDQGNALIPQVGRRGMGGGPWRGPRRFGRRPMVGTKRLYAIFQPPPDEVSRLARLQGKVSVVVETRSRVWEVADPLTALPSTQIVDSVPVTLEKLGRNPSDDGYELRATIPARWTSEGAQEQVLELARNRLKLLDASGQALQLGTIDAQAGSEEMEMTVNFGHGEGRRPPARIVWEVPVETRSLAVPFDFKDVPIGNPFEY